MQVIVRNLLLRLLLCFGSDVTTMTSDRAMGSEARDWLTQGGAWDLIGPWAWGVRADWLSGSDVTSRDGEAFEVRVSGGEARRSRRRRSPFR